MAEEKKKIANNNSKKTNNKNKKNYNQQNGKKTNSNMKKGNNTPKKEQKKPVNQQQSKQQNKNVKKKPQVPVKQTVSKEKEIKKEKLEETKKIIEEIELEKEPEIEIVEQVEKVIEEETKEDETILDKTLIIGGEESENLREVVNNLEKEKIIVKNKVIDRSKVKRIITMILATLIVLTLLLGSIYIVKEEFIKHPTLNSDVMTKVNKNQKEDFDSTEIVDEDEYEKIVMINVEEFEKKILNKEDITVIVTESTCYFCLQYEPIVEEVLQEQNKTIYEIDIYKLTPQEVNRFREYYAFTTMPTIFTIKDGIVTGELEGAQEKSTVSTWLETNTK